MIESNCSVPTLRCPVCKQGYNLSKSEIESLPVKFTCVKCGNVLEVVNNNQKSVHNKIVSLNTIEMALYLGTNEGFDLCCGKNCSKLSKSKLECLNCWTNFLLQNA